MIANSTLVLANYPMFFQSNNWMGWRQKKEPKTFSDANSESVYNATVLLLSDDKDPRGVLADYYWGGRDHPPTWLLTLDRQGFLPVDVFPHDAAYEPKDKWFQPVPAAADGTKPVTPSLTQPLLPPPARAWSIVSTAVALVCVALSLWILVISLDRNLEMDARFSFLQINSESGWRRFHVLALLAVLLLMEAIVWIPGWRTEWVDRWSATEVYLIPALGCAAVFCTGLVVLTRLKPDRRVRVEVWLGVAGMAVLFPACLALWIRACMSSKDRNLFFAFRALELRFGSSPTWPVLAALGAFALFAFVQLTRFYLAACQRPDIVTDELATALRARLREACENFNGVLESSLGLRRTARCRHRMGLVLFGIGGLVAIVFRIDRQMRSIDAGHWPVVILQIALMLLLLLTGMHIRSLWQSFQSFLAGLNMLPLAHSFKPVDHSGTERPIWVRRLNLQSIDVDVQSIYAIHNMTVAAKALEPDFPHTEYLTWLNTKSAEYSSRVRGLLNVERRSRETTLKLIRAIRNDNKAIASETLKFLREFWLVTPLTSPEIVEKPNDGGKPAHKDPTSAKGPLEELGGLAQRFVALHYSSFILYGVRQIQNLFLFLSSGFVLLMISLNCYSIQGPQFIGRVLLALFLILGSVTLPCLAGLERDPVLSRMAGSEPGKLNTGFYLKIATYGALPTLGLLASEFPSISGFLLSWVEPTLEAFR